jgi:hypothetical protein
LTPTASFDFFLLADGRERGGIFLDEFDRRELLGDQPRYAGRLDVGER